jgi:hypothetical protein
MGIRRLAIANPSATTDTTLFTADNQYLISVIATNKSSNTSATIRVWVEPSGATLDSQFAYIVYDIPVDASNSYETFRFAINQNDEVHVYTSNATISFQSYGLVQYDVNLGVGISSYQASAPAIKVDGLIWVDADGTLPGTTAKPAYVWSSSANDWIPMAGSFDASLNNTFTGTNIFTGSVTIPGYEKSIPLQSSAPSSPASSDLWVDNTTPTAPQLKVYNGSSWVALGNTVNDSQAVIAQRMFA